MLFDRVYRLLVGQVGEQAGIEITELRMTFEITKTTDKNPNPGKITVWNLTAATRARFEQPGTRVALYAGYANDAGPILLYTGNVTHAYLQVDGPDYATVFELGDGAQEIRDGVISVGYDAGVGSDTVLADASTALGLPMTLPDDAPRRTWTYGMSYYGPARGLLDKCCAASGLEWSVQNGCVQVIARGGVTTRQGIVLAVDSGLLGSPERMREARVETSSQGDAEVIAEAAIAGWRVRTLLMPQLNPGDRVILESRTVEGVFRVDDIRHSGDSHAGGDWQSELRLVDPAQPAAARA